MISNLNNDNDTPMTTEQHYALESLHQASRYNHIGVSLLRTSDCMGAIRAFRSALSAVQGIVAETNEESFQVEEPTKCHYEDIKEIQDSHYYFYNRALLFEATHVSSMDFISSLLTCNLAMAFHKIGLETGKVSALLKAASFYDFSANLAENGSPESESLVIVARNNQALILQSLGRYEQSQEALGSVRILLNELPFQIDLECSKLIDMTIFTEIFLNVEAMKPPHSAPCA